jgi:hypothetical protein
MNRIKAIFKGNSFVVAYGNSQRQVLALVEQVMTAAQDNDVPPQGYEVRNEAGELLPPLATLEEAKVAPYGTVFINLPAGVGG